MDYQQIKDSLTNDVLKKYIPDSELIPGTINTFIDKLNNYPETDITQPFDAEYLKRKLSFLSSNYPEYIASILILGKTENDHLLPNLNTYSLVTEFDWDDLNIQTIANAESIVKEAQEHIQSLLKNDSITAKNVNSILKDIEPLADAEPYNDIRNIYWMLYCEFRVTLQFMKPKPKWDFFFTIGAKPIDWLRIRGNDDTLALKYLHENSIDDYVEHPKIFCDELLTSVKNGCVSESGTKPDDKPTKTSLEPNDSSWTIELLPSAINKKGKHDNKVTINDQTHIISDKLFDFIYTVIWIQKNKVAQGLYKYHKNLNDELKEMKPNDYEYPDWCCSDDAHAKTRVKANVKKRLDYELIIYKDDYYSCNPEISLKNITLNPYT
ncbi:MAG: hypothetical protein HOO10_04870 [Candidatus Marinimicrobia bacterium]|nr:hypothetical protein [Candidatus Neomarinimicrobiota bacterium]